MKTTLAAGAAAAFAPAGFGHAAEAKLSWKHFPAGPNGFFRAPVLLSGPTEALLIDGGFSYSDGRALARRISECEGHRRRCDSRGDQGQRREEARRLGAQAQGERPAGAFGRRLARGI